MQTLPIPDVQGYRRIAFDEIDSTNAYALECARSGAEGNLWVTAARQSGGRGRRGRKWISEPGNLYASLLVVEPAPWSRIGTLPLVAALAAHRALRPLFPKAPYALAIKWPNDILVDGKKLVGILLESERPAGKAAAIAIGCGVNCRHHPGDTAFPATDLAECGVEAGPDEVFPLLAAGMAETLAQWDRGLGFASIRRDWLLAAEGPGKLVTVRWPDREATGLFEDIDADGQLLLVTAKGERQRVSAGDLFFQASAARGA